MLSFSTLLASIITCSLSLVRPGSILFPLLFAQSQNCWMPAVINPLCFKDDGCFGFYREIGPASDCFKVTSETNLNTQTYNYGFDLFIPTCVIRPSPPSKFTRACSHSALVLLLLGTELTCCTGYYFPLFVQSHPQVLTQHANGNNVTLITHL